MVVTEAEILAHIDADETAAMDQLIVGDADALAERVLTDCMVKRQLVALGDERVLDILARCWAEAPRS